MVDLFQSPSISGYNDNPPPDDDSETSANAVSWSKHKTKLGDPLKTLIETAITLTNTAFERIPIKSTTAHSANHTLTTNDYGGLLVTTNAITITLLAGATAGSNFVFYFFNADASNSLTLGRNGANINGSAADLTIPPGGCGLAACDGTNWRVFDLPRLTADNTFSGTLTMFGAAQNYAASADVASAGTTNIGAAASNNVRITGTTTITAFDTVAAGITRKVRFAGVLTLTHNATSLILPESGNITTAADDTAEFLSLGSGNWKCLWFEKTPRVQVFTASGSFVAKRTGNHVVFVAGAGGGGGSGGGGGGGVGGGGGGGGGAGAFRVMHLSLTKGTSYTVTVGGGGAGGAGVATGVNGNAGAAGGQSVFDATTAGGGGGGGGGQRGNDGGAAGAAGTNGPGTATGGTAGTGANNGSSVTAVMSTAGGAGGSNNSSTGGGGGGAGGCSLQGLGTNGAAGGAAGVAGSAATTNTANRSAGGGAGGGGGNNAAGGAGADGSDGLVVVFW